MINVVIALLELKKVITKEEAQKLANELRFSTLTDKYSEAQRLIKEILK